MKRRLLVNSALVAATSGFFFSASGSSPGWAQIDEVIVTTRKREENLQDIPLSVAAIGAERIEKFGIDSIKDVAKFTSGIQFDEGFGAQDNRIVIRGLSPTRGRPNAAFLVDGIDFTGEAISTAGGAFSVNQRLLDVERVEIVKGPQSALYGRSAFAGALQYVTKNPNMDEFEAEAGFDIADYGQYEVNGAVSGPVAEGLGIRLNGLWHQEDGFHKNSLTNDEVGDGEGWGLSGTALWEPNEDLSFKLRVAYSEEEMGPAAQARYLNQSLVPIPIELVNRFILADIFSIGGNYLDCNAAGALNGTADGPNILTNCFGTPKVLNVGKLPNGDDLEIALSPDPRTGRDYEGTQVDTLNVTLVGQWDVGFGNVTSYTGYASTEATQKFDSDWDALLPSVAYSSTDGLFGFTLPDCGFADCSPVAQEVFFENDTELFSQELRFATDFDGPFNFTVGGLYWKETAEQLNTNITVTSTVFRGRTNVAAEPSAASLLIGPSIIDPGFTSRETDHWSIYGVAEYQITDQFKATFEGRYVEEDVTVIGPQCDVVATAAKTGGVGIVDGACDPQTFRAPTSTEVVDGVLLNPVPFNASAEATESFFAPKGTLEWAPNDDQLWYFSIARGIKPGGVSTLTAGSFFTPENLGFDKEKLLAYELGNKSSFADGRFQLNTAVFFQEYTDKQVGVTQTIDGVDRGRITNAGAAEIWGVELEALWQPTENWAFQGSYNWLDAEYTDFFTPTNSSNEVARNTVAGNGGCLAINDGICDVDFTGNDVEDIPEHSFVGSAQYTAPLANTDMEWFVQTSAIFTDERFIDESNTKLLDSYWTADLRAGLIAEGWDLTFYVDNVFDDDTVKSAIDVGSQVQTLVEGQFPPGPSDGVVASIPDPRVFGVRGKIRF